MIATQGKSRKSLRTELRAGAPGDGVYACVVIVNNNGKKEIVCEQIK
jgi:hypothetical protein